MVGYINVRVGAWPVCTCPSAPRTSLHHCMADDKENSGDKGKAPMASAGGEGAEEEEEQEEEEEEECELHAAAGVL